MSDQSQDIRKELIDPVGRTVDYLRLSVTDRCNERCLYCMPENYHDWLPRKEILSYEELLSIVKVSVKLGFKRFRVTGGEPLVRRDIVSFMEQLIKTSGVESVTLTTNGTRLKELAAPLYRTGLRQFNMSLDALDPDVYRAVTHADIQPVLDGLAEAIRVGFRQIKLNVVLMRGKNENQLLPLVNFAAKHQLVIRFIELMPVSLTEMLSEENFYPLSEIKSVLNREEELIPVEERLGHGPAQYFKMKKLGVTVGFIGALTDLHFCDRCNKMRLTCDGKLRPCLGNHLEKDLKPALRPQFEEKKLEALIRGILAEKPAEHLFRDNYQPQRVMTAIGG